MEASDLKQTPVGPIASQLERDGFVIIPGFVAAEACDRLRNEAAQLVSDFNPKKGHSVFSSKDHHQIVQDYFLESANKIHFFYEPGACDSKGELTQPKEKSINKIGHALHRLNPIFREFSSTPELYRLWERLGFVRPNCIQSMYIFKQPRIGAEVVSHQDGTFLYTEPMSVIGFWFALEDAHRENGCLYALPGGHQVGLKRRYVRKDQGQCGFEELDFGFKWPEEEFVPLEVLKGSLIILHALLPHRSATNLSDQSRHAYTLHVVDETAHYPKENWLQVKP